VQTNKKCAKMQGSTLIQGMINTGFLWSRVLGPLFD